MTLRRSTRNKLLLAVRVVPFALVLAAPPTAGAQAPPTPEALAKATQNPIAAMPTVSFQSNFNNGGGLEDSTLFNLNLQPVIPFRLTDAVNVIARTIVPIGSAPAPGGTRYSGVSDIQAQIYFTPARPGSFVWGVGPMLSLPTATAAPFETGTFGAGLGGVIVKNVGPFVLGGVLTQVWPASDVGGAPRTDVLTLQPFVNYNLAAGWALSTAPMMTANWDADEGNQWTVPLGLGVTKTTVFNGRPMNIGFQYYYNVERPAGAPGQQFRFSIALLYPQAPR